MHFGQQLCKILRRKNIFIIERCDSSLATKTWNRDAAGSPGGKKLYALKSCNSFLDVRSEWLHEKRKEGKRRQWKVREGKEKGREGRGANLVLGASRYNAKRNSKGTKRRRV